ARAKESGCAFAEQPRSTDRTGRDDGRKHDGNNKEIKTVKNEASDLQKREDPRQRTYRLRLRRRGVAKMPGEEGREQQVRRHDQAKAGVEARVGITPAVEHEMDVSHRSIDGKPFLGRWPKRKEPECVARRKQHENDRNAAIEQFCRHKTSPDQKPNA